MEITINVAPEKNVAGKGDNVRRFLNRKQLEDTSLAFILKGEMPPEDEIEVPIRLGHCPKCDGLYFFNVHTGEFGNASCKAYGCDYCGPKKAFKFEIALREYFQQYKHIRLFTFTFRTSVLDNTPDPNKASSEIWRRFVVNLRRSSSLSSSQRNVDYVRILELTKRGYPHFHIFMSEYMPIQVISGIFNNAVNQVCGSTGTNSHIEVTYSGTSKTTKNKGNFNAESASRYCAKYVLKSAKEKPENMRLWSKSGNVRLFPEKKFSCGWFFLNSRTSLLNLYEFGITSRTPLPGETYRKSLIEIVRSHFPGMKLDEQLSKVNEMSEEYFDAEYHKNMALTEIKTSPLF